jgi:hypothetical protein
VALGCPWMVGWGGPWWIPVAWFFVTSYVAV